jgi:hypothetical protein
MAPLGLRLVIARLDRAIHRVAVALPACAARPHAPASLDRPVKPGDDGKASPDIFTLWPKRVPQPLHLLMAGLDLHLRVVMAGLDRATSRVVMAGLDRATSRVVMAGLDPATSRVVMARPGQVASLLSRPGSTGLPPCCHGPARPGHPRHALEAYLLARTGPTAWIARPSRPMTSYGGRNRPGAGAQDPAARHRPVPDVSSLPCSRLRGRCSQGPASPPGAARLGRRVVLPGLVAVSSWPRLVTVYCHGPARPGHPAPRWRAGPPGCPRGAPRDPRSSQRQPDRTR